MNLADYNPKNIHAMLARIEQKLDYLIEQRSIHALEIENLKKFKWIAIGISMATGFAGGAASHLVK